ncbi:DMT family transporter [Rhodopila sp.]|uniref:DMT family transporter n=1 Tax=Rhodopila sp. TaxID=2480087 RepID=UPI003D137F1B
MDPVIAGTPSGERNQSWQGILLVLGSAAAFSTAGYFTRLITVDAWSVLFWRGLFGGLFIAVYVIIKQGRRTLVAIRTIWPVGVLVAACSTLGTICFINALRRTTVADVTLINATAPFITAAIGRMFLGERESKVTLAASGIALVGVLLTLDGAVANGHLLGDMLGLVMTIAIAVMMVLIRSHRRTPMLPAASLSAFASALLVLPLAHPEVPNAEQLVYLMLFGVTQFGLGLLLLTLGARLISPTRAALLGNLEIPLAPALVWVAFGEIPPMATCTGGALVMLAVLGDLLMGKAKA